MHRKISKHNLENGPRKKEENLHLFKELCETITIQLAFIESIIHFKVDINMQNTVAKLIHRTIKFFDCVIWVDDTSSEYTSNGLPIKYNFMWEIYFMNKWYSSLI